MSETHTLLAFSVFIGGLALMSISAAQTIPQLEQIEGVERYENFETSDSVLSDINATSYISSGSITVQNGDVSWDGTVNDRGGMYGYVRYDVSNLADYRVEFTTSLLDDLRVIFYDEQENVIDNSTVGSPLNVDVSDFEQTFGTEPYYMELRLDSDEVITSFQGLSSTRTGWIAQIEALISIFRGLSSSTDWFNLLVGIPIGIVSLYILLRLLSGFLPFTG